MKNKLKIKTILITFLIIAVISMNVSSALIPSVDISQIPDTNSVTNNSDVKVTVKLTSSLIIDDREALVHAELRYFVDGQIKTPIIYDIDEPKSFSPTLTIRFVLGTFESGSKVDYTIHLEFLISIFDYDSDTYSFVVESTDSINFDYIWIYIASGIAFVALVIIIFKKIKN